jgi:hypothetical protein
MTFPVLPQLQGGLFLSDGGMETCLIYLEGVDLPQFASFILLNDVIGRRRLTDYYRPYLELAAETPHAGFILETPTWRASSDWGKLLSYDESALVKVNNDAVSLIRELRDEWQPRIDGPVVLSGQIGPRGDGYVTSISDSAQEAYDYHLSQARALSNGGVDMLSAMTMTSSAEAIGVARAAHAVGVPVSVSFTVETDGRLPSGEGLGGRHSGGGRRYAASLLRVELCTSQSFRSTSRRRWGTGYTESAAFVPMRRHVATPSWMPRLSSTSETPRRSATATEDCVLTRRHSTCSAGVAELTYGICEQSGMPVWEQLTDPRHSSAAKGETCKGAGEPRD